MIRRAVRAAALGAAALVLLTACAGSGASDAGPAVPSESELIGRWLPVERTGGTEPFVEFADDGTLTGSDGCNGVGGSWSLEGDGTFSAELGPSTLIACDGAPVGAMLAKTRAVRLEQGTLSLLDEDLALIGDFTRS